MHTRTGRPTLTSRRLPSAILHLLEDVCGKQVMEQHRREAGRVRVRLYTRG